MQPHDLLEEYVDIPGAMELLGLTHATFFRRKKQGYLPQPERVFGKQCYRKSTLAALKASGVLQPKRGRKKNEVD
jgi:hypothetical protein